MKVVIVGATGVIGGAIANVLSPDHDIVRAARSGADLWVDATDPTSIRAFYDALGPFDALVSAIGSGGMGPLAKLDDEAFESGWRTKIMAQVNLVRLGLATIRDAGSFTLSSGVLSKAPMRGFSAIALANGAMDAFCRSAALEMPRNVRINSVSPVFVIESMAAAGISDMSAYPTQSARDTAVAYARAVTGSMTGCDIDPRVGP